MTRKVRPAACVSLLKSVTWKSAREHLSSLRLLAVQRYARRLRSSSIALRKLSFRVSGFHSWAQTHQVEAQVFEAEGVPDGLWVRKPAHFALIFAELRCFSKQGLESVADNSYKSLFGNSILMVIKPLLHRRCAFDTKLLVHRGMFICTTHTSNNFPKFFVFPLEFGD